jgi:hypothetical protein
MTDRSLIATALTNVEAQHGDLNDAVYALLFDTSPDYLDLFLLDYDGGVRRNMLLTSLEIITRYAQGGDVTNRLEGARLSHVTYEVSDAVFDQFFDIIEQVVASKLGAKWSHQHRQAWHDMRTLFTATAG